MDPKWVYFKEATEEYTMSISSIGSFSMTGLSSMSNLSRTQSKQSDPSEFLAKIMEQEDTNGDGVISADETRLDSDRFGELDADGNGALSTDELEAGLKAGPAGGAPPAFGPPPIDPSKLASKIIDQEDTNGDGVISADETRLDSDRFGELDTDSNGSLTTEELLASFQAREDQMPDGMPPASGMGMQGSGEGGDMIQSLLDALNQNSASNAYQSQGWFSQSFGASTQSLSVDA
jgi:Ca2+-binding EF-hand superfamily protein